jgi:CHAT domain-containing protein
MEQYISAGNYVAAASLGNSLNELYRQRHLTQEESYGWLLYDLGLCFDNMGAYAGADYFLNLAEAFWINTKGRDSHEYILTIAERASMSVDAHDFDTASEYLEKVKSHPWRKSKNISRLVYLTEAKLLNSEGETLEAIARLEQMEQMGLGDYSLLKNSYKVRIGRSIEVRDELRKQLGTIKVLQSNAACSKMEQLMNILSTDSLTRCEALSYGDKIITYYKESMSTLTSSYADILYLQAKNYWLIGEHAKAIHYETRAANILKNLNGASVVSEYNTLRTLALMHWHDKHPTLAAQYAQASLDLSIPNIADNMMMEKNWREQVWSQNSSWYLSGVAQIAVAEASDSILKRAYDCQLIGKGLLLHTELSIQDWAQRSSEEVQRLYQNWARLQNDLEMATTPERYQDAARRCREAYSIFKKAAVQAGNFDTYFDDTWNDVAAALHEDERAIEFIHCVDTCHVSTYYALILSHDSAAPALVKVCTAEQLESLPAEEVNEKMSEQIWAPMKEQLCGAKTVYFAPCGDLHTMPIETAAHLYQPYRAVRVSSTKQLIYRVPSAPIQSAQLYGGIDYGAFNNETNNELNKREGSDYGIGPLAGSTFEVQQCQALLSAQSVHAETHTGLTATEQQFHSLSGSANQLLHIATHGLFLNSEPEPIDAFNLIQETSRRNTIAPDELSHSAIAMALANNTLLHRDSTVADNDGILTAQEISHLDLHRVDFVILSACGSGLGRISGEGVFGLQRGFKKAGVKTLMMSLWKVDDEATRYFMTEFYKYWLGDGHGVTAHTKQEALEHAQAEVQAVSQWSDPEYWAAFVLLDDIN